jgi:hypothetical protein
MAKQPGILEKARQLLDKRTSFDDFRGKVSARDGGNVDRHLAAMAEEPDDAHRTLWKRLATTLASLAPHSITTTGQQVISFFIADGKYRMQAFALEDKRDGSLVIYASDALKDAIDSKLLRGPGKDSESAYQIDGGQTLSVEPLTAQNTPNPQPFYKHMLGWNRTAVRITLPVKATTEQLVVAENLCALAALRWADAAAKSAAGKPPTGPAIPAAR